MPTLLHALAAACCALPQSGEPAPADLPEPWKIEVRRRLASTAEALRGNVVQLSIEQRVGDGRYVAVEASGLVIDPRGHVVTIGTVLEQAGRVAVHFSNAPQLRPRRARLLGIDELCDVGVLEIGPVSLPRPELSAPAPAPAASSEARYVVALCGVPDEAQGRVAAGWLHDPLPNPTLGRARVEWLLRVTTSRAPRFPGVVVAHQDGRVAGLLLAPPQASGAAPPAEAMLALPAQVVVRGVASVLERAQGAEEPRSAAARAWVGFGAVDLEETEFLRQLGCERAVVVREIFEESPALAAGLEPHDVIVAWNGEALGGVDELAARLAASSPGLEVTLDVVRALARRRVNVTLGAW